MIPHQTVITGDRLLVVFDGLAARESRKEGTGSGIPKVAGSGSPDRGKCSRENVFSYFSICFWSFIPLLLSFPFLFSNQGSSTQLPRGQKKLQNDAEKPMEMVSYCFAYCSFQRICLDYQMTTNKASKKNIPFF